MLQLLFQPVLAISRRLQSDTSLATAAQSTSSGMAPSLADLTNSDTRCTSADASKALNPKPCVLRGIIKAPTVLQIALASDSDDVFGLRGCHTLPMGSQVVPFWGLPYRILNINHKRNYLGAYGSVHVCSIFCLDLNTPDVFSVRKNTQSSRLPQCVRNGRDGIGHGDMS